MSEPTSSSCESQLQVDRPIWIDGELRPWADATVHLLSHSLQRGSLVFDYMSIHALPQGDAVFRMREHLERFVESCRMVGLHLAQSLDELSEAVLLTCRANPGARALKICGYLASIEIDVVPTDDHVTVAIAAYDPVADIALRKPSGKRGKKRPTLRLWIEKDIRNRRADIVPAQAKVSANYSSPMTAKQRAREAGYDEILLVDEHGLVAEGPTTNLFLVDREGTLKTPPTDRVLLGVTRRSILELAKQDGIPVREVPIRPEELHEASEVFLTGTTAGVWPVESIDGQPVADVVPGPVSKALGEHFQRASAGEDPDFAHWLTPIQSTTSNSE